MSHEVPGIPWYRRLAARCKARGDFKELHDRTNAQQSLYMTRYQVFKSNAVSVYLHQIHRDDDAADAHDHPWPFFHVILEGFYFEEYFSLSGDYRMRLASAGKLPWHLGGFMAFHRAAYAHRITLTPCPEAWTLVVIGPKVREWGFVGFFTGCWVHWKEYVYQGFRCE